MATSLCGSIGTNTGPVLCDVKRGLPLQLLLGSAIFQPSDYVDQATLDAAFLSKTKLAGQSTQKIYPFPPILDTNDVTEAAKYGTFGYGTKILLTRSKQGYEFLVDAGTQLEKKMIAFNGQTIPLFVDDDRANRWGKIDTAGNFTGVNYQISVDPAGFQDGKNAKASKVTISVIDSRDFIENAAVYTTAVTGLAGLKDVYMKYLSNSSNAYKIKFFIKTSILNGDLDIYDDYGSLISALTFTAFTGTNFTTSLAITSVAVDAATKSLLVTFDSTAFGALASGAKIKLVAPIASVLDSAGVTQIEIGSVILTK